RAGSQPRFLRRAASGPAGRPRVGHPVVQRAREVRRKRNASSMEQRLLAHFGRDRLCARAPSPARRSESACPPADGVTECRVADPLRRISWPPPDRDVPDALVTREWLVTNALGGYASGTVAGVMTRRYHGLLIAALGGQYG